MPQDPEKVQIIRDKVNDLLKKHATEEVKGSQKRRGFFSAETVGNWRPFIDLSSLNKFIICLHFKMEKLNSIRLSLKKGDLGTSLDL